VLIAVLGAGLFARSQTSSGVWLDVPFVKQSEEGCGSASLAMVLQYWNGHGKSIPGERFDADAIQAKLYSRKERGILASSMRKYLEDSGFRVFAVAGEWNDLRTHLSEGRPLIVSLQPGSKRTPLHYVVVTGIDWEHQAVFLNDPARGQLLRVERAEFEKEWQAVRNWMLLAVPEAAK
jgi:predicted double-glycine peptidase